MQNFTTEQAEAGLASAIIAKDKAFAAWVKAGRPQIDFGANGMPGIEQGRLQVAQEEVRQFTRILAETKGQ